MGSIADYHLNKTYALMYGVTQRSGNAKFSLTQKLFTPRRTDVAKIYRELSDITKKYTFKILNLKSEQDAENHIKNIQNTMSEFSKQPNNFVDYSLKNFSQLYKNSLTLRSSNIQNENLSTYVKKNLVNFGRLDAVGRKNAQSYNMSLKDYNSYVDASAGKIKNNINRFIHLANNSKSPEDFSKTQDYVTGVLVNRVGAINEMMLANAFENVLNLGKTKLTGTRIRPSGIGKIKSTYKGDFVTYSNNSLVFSSVKWKSKEDKREFKLVEDLSLTAYKGTAYSEFMSEIVNLRLSAMSGPNSRIVNVFIAALLADLAFFGSKGRPLLFISSTYSQSTGAKVEINFIYELFDNYIQNNIYPTSIPSQFRYAYLDSDSRIRNASDAVKFYQNVSENDKYLQGYTPYMTKSYFEQKVLNASLTVRGRFMKFKKK